MKTILFFSLFCFLSCSVFSQKLKAIYSISNDLELVKISTNAYVHVSYTESTDWGRYPSNGLVLLDHGIAFLFDTPTSDSLTKKLLTFLKDSLKLTITGFITNDWHSDSMGGLHEIQIAGIPSYASEMTRKIAASKKLPVPEIGFNDSIRLFLGEKEIFCKYLGAAHTLDNIVVYIPSERILFADCMVKELKSTNLGNTSDGDLHAYLSTISAVRANFPDAKIVIPGHGDVGGIELLNHTINLAK